MILPDNQSNVELRHANIALTKIDLRRKRVIELFSCIIPFFRFLIVLSGRSATNQLIDADVLERDHNTKFACYVCAQTSSMAFSTFFRDFSRRSRRSYV